MALRGQVGPVSGPILVPGPASGTRKEPELEGGSCPSTGWTNGGFLAWLPARASSPARAWATRQAQKGSEADLTVTLVPASSCQVNGSTCFSLT